MRTVLSVFRKSVFTFVLALPSLWILPCAADLMPENQRSFSLTPYLWVPAIGGTLRIGTPDGGSATTGFDINPNEYIDSLDRVLMLSGEMRLGDWSITSDLMYQEFSGGQSIVHTLTGLGGIVQIPINAGAQMSMESLVLTLAAGYTVARSATSTFEVLGGIRYLGIEPTVDFQLSAPVLGLALNVRLSEKEELWDGIVGVRGKANLGESNWFVPFYLDAGTGSSRLTWQGVGGIGYSFEWGDAGFSYRHLAYEQKSDKLIQDMRFSGPALSARFRF